MGRCLSSRLTTPRGSTPPRQARAKELEQKCAELEQRAQTLERENFVLRQVLKSSMASAPAFPPEPQQSAAPEVLQVVPDAEVPDMHAKETA